MNSADSNLTDPFPTRSSLLSRMRNLDDDKSWREFHELYGQLIREVVIRSGVRSEDAPEIVQETMVVLAAYIPEFRYDPAKGSFKAWLRTLTRNRVADHFRRMYRKSELPNLNLDEPADLPDMQTSTSFDTAWEDEWRRHMLGRALACLGSKVTARDRQVFDLAVVNAWSLQEVRKATGVSLTHIYVIRHRVGRLVKAEVERLRRDLE